jgi:hypothetical protein
MCIIIKCTGLVTLRVFLRFLVRLEHCVESVVSFFSRVSLIILSWFSLPVVIIMGQLKLNGSDVVTTIRIRAPIRV